MSLAISLLVWLILALTAGASGWLQQVRPPGPQLILLGLTIFLLVSWWARSGIGAGLARLDLRLLLGLHLTRFVGFHFLYLYHRGELPHGFAVPAGYGDIVIALGALLLLLGWSTFGRQRIVLLTWNSLGLLDILFVVVTAARIAMSQPESMAALLRLPLSLLPTFLVPLIIVSHVIIFGRLQRAATDLCQKK